MIDLFENSLFIYQFDTYNIAIIFLIFLIAGLVKGATGLGVTTVPVALLTVSFDLLTAMAIVIIPAFTTNLWQASVGGHGRDLLKRLWPFLVPAILTIWIGTIVLGQANVDWLSALLGAALLLYGLANLLGFRLSIDRPHETWSGAAFGVMNGTLTGMTGSIIVPGVFYLQAIGLSRDALLQAIGILCTLSLVALGIALGNLGLVDKGHAIVSFAAIVPASIGMAAGQVIRSRLSDTAFRQMFFSSMFLIGVYIAVTKSLGEM